MVERATRWLLRSRPRPLDIAAEVARFAEGARTVAGALPGVLVESEQEAWRERVARADRGRACRRTLAGARGDAGRAVLARSTSSRSRARPSATIEEVAALHFLLGGKLAPALAARPDRAAPARQPLAAMARAALRDDLFTLHAGAHRRRAALRRRSTRWLEANRAAVERAQEILGEIRAGGTFDLTTLPVALREVRNLIQLRSPAPAA